MSNLASIDSLDLYGEGKLRESGHILCIRKAIFMWFFVLLSTARRVSRFPKKASTESGRKRTLMQTETGSKRPHGEDTRPLHIFTFLKNRVSQKFSKTIGSGFFSHIGNSSEYHVHLMILIISCVVYDIFNTSCQTC